MAKTEREEFIKDANNKITKISTTTETDYNIDGDIAALNSEKIAYQQIITNIDVKIASLNAVKTRHA